MTYLPPFQGYFLSVVGPGAACFALAPGYPLRAPSALRRLVLKRLREQFAMPRLRLFYV
jgi:hypothetical protein